MKHIIILSLSLGISISPVFSQAIRTGFDTGSLAANDDGSTGAIDLGFSLNFFGNQRTQAFLNNNGNITLDAPLASFTPSGVDLPTAEIIAPFFADVDTTGDGSKLMTYGSGQVAGRTAFGVNWIDVGYFSGHDDKLNSFQLILVNRSDLSPGAFDIEFNYGQIQWESGDANDGSSNGLGGETARAGYSNGNGTNFEELEGSSVPGAFLDGGSNALTDLTNVRLPGRYVTLVRDGEILVSAPITEVGLATLRDSVTAFSGYTTQDLNRRLFRNRTGNQLNHFKAGHLDTKREIEVFGSYDAHSMTIDQRLLSNAGGLITTLAPESRLEAYSSSVGIETDLISNLKIGGAALFGKGDFKHEDGSFNGDLDSLGLAAYLSYYYDNPSGTADFYFDVLGAYTQGDIALNRRFSDVYDIVTDGKTEFTSTELQLNLGFVFKQQYVHHGPFSQLKIVSGKVDSYEEVTDGFGSSTSPKIDFDSSKIQLGYQASLSYGNFIPQVRISYEKELEDQNTTINTLQLAAPPESAIVAGFGVSYDPGSGMFATLNYEYRYYEEGATANSFGIGFGMNF